MYFFTFSSSSVLSSLYFLTSFFTSPVLSTFRLLVPFSCNPLLSRSFPLHTALQICTKSLHFHTFSGIHNTTCSVPFLWQSFVLDILHHSRADPVSSRKRRSFVFHHTTPHTRAITLNFLYFPLCYSQRFARSTCLRYFFVIDIYSIVKKTQHRPGSVFHSSSSIQLYTYTRHLSHLVVTKPYNAKSLH